jgi:dTDP-4-amino-4,6-dideoxygalactose transaminase
MDAINAVAKQHGLSVVADACHGILSRYRGLGIAACAETSCFSMHPLKNLNVWGDGGLVLTNNEAIAERLYSIRNHGLQDRDICQEFAYNSRLDTIQAVVGQYLLDKRIENITQARIANAALLDAALCGLDDVFLPARAPEKTHVYHLYMGVFERRDELQQYLQSQGIDAKVHYPVPMHLQPAAEYLGYQRGDFPRAENVANTCLSLPVHEFISAQDIDHMAASIKAFYRG